MIELTHFGARGDAFWLNPDLVVTIDAKPDTVLSLTNGTKVMVAEAPAVVVDRIRDWRHSLVSRPLNPIR